MNDLERLFLGYAQEIGGGRMFVEPDVYERETKRLEACGWLVCERFQGPKDDVYRVRLTPAGQRFAARLGAGPH